MDESVKKYKERRDSRLKKRMDDDWITIKGTHVMVDDDKNITKGPEKLRGLSNKNRAIKVEDLPEKEAAPKNGARVISGGDDVYEKIPVVFRVGGAKYATAEEKKKRKETIDRFMKNANEGDVYSAGGGFGSGGSKFKVVRSRGKMALQWMGGSSRPVEMSRANVEKFIANGAKKVKE